MASCSPVLAPDGTAARPTAPPSRRTSTSTVGLPRESRIRRPYTCSIADPLTAAAPWPVCSSGPVRRATTRSSVRRRPLDPRYELARRLSERELGIDVQSARKVDHGEEHVSDLVDNTRIRLALGLRHPRPIDLCAQLLELGMEVLDHRLELPVIEADRGGAAL